MADAKLSAERADLYLGAALRCFARYGYRRTSMGAIAEAADVSRPALYQYFSSKEDIFRAAAEWELTKLAARVETQAAEPGNTETRLVAVLEAALRLHRSTEEAGRAGGPFYGEMLDETYARAADVWATFESRVLAALRSTLEGALDRPTNTEYEPPVDSLAEILFYGAKGIAEHMRDAKDVLERTTQLVTLTLRGGSTETRRGPVGEG